MKDRKVLVGTRGPLGSSWRVALPAGGLPFILLGWRVAAEIERDGGMPETVGMLLAEALLRVGVLSYPSSSLPAASTDTQIRPMIGAGLGNRLRAVLSRAPSKMWLVTATSPSVACQLFDDPGFPWWMQGQIALISASSSSVDLDRPTLLKLMDPMRPMRRDELHALSLKAVVQPGVDGDVAVIISIDSETDAAVVAAIEATAQKFGFQWHTGPEAEFASVLSDQHAGPPGTG